MLGETPAKLSPVCASERLVAGHRAAVARPPAGRSVVPALQKIVAEVREPAGPRPCPLDARRAERLDAALTRELLRDADPRMRIQAMRASETLYKAGDRSFEPTIAALSKDSDTDVVIQAMLTMNMLKVADTRRLVKTVAGTTRREACSSSAEKIADINAAAGRGGGRGGRVHRSSRAVSSAAASSTRSCAIRATAPTDAVRRRRRIGRCHAGAVACWVAARQRASRVRHQVRAAWTVRSYRWQSYPQVMVAMGTNSDQWIADITSYVRNSFGNIGALATSADVARVRTATGRDRRGPSRSSRLLFHARWCPIPPGRSRPVTTGDPARKPTPRAATTTWATLPAPSVSWAGRRVCHSSRVCGSR